MKQHCYTQEEIDFLKDNAAGRTYAELTDMFNRRFNHSVKSGSIEYIFYKHNLRKPIRPKNLKFTPEQIQFLKDRAASGRSYKEIAELFNQKFICSETRKTIRNIFYTHKIKLCYKPVQIGDEYITSFGYTLVRIDNPSAKNKHDLWKLKHILIWEAANGPVPKGHCIMFADRNRSNYNLDNLLLVSYQELAVMNNSHLIFLDAKRTKNGLLVAKLIILIKDKEREAKKLKQTV
jgi:hypothetical protein